MDSEARSRGPLVAIVVAGIVVVALAVLGAVALFGNADPDSPSSSPGPSSGLPALTTTRPSSLATTTLPSASAPSSEFPGTTAGESSAPGDTTEPGAGTPDGLPGYDSEACALFRQLLEMIDDGQLRAGAAQAGCI